MVLSLRAFSGQCGGGVEAVPHNKKLPKSCLTLGFLTRHMCFKKTDYKYLSLEHNFAFIHKRRGFLISYYYIQFPMNTPNM